MEEKITRLADYFGVHLAQLLAGKIGAVYKDFDSDQFIQLVREQCGDKSLTQRVELVADQLYKLLPANYKKTARIFTKIMGPENPHETGMFKHYFWLMPVGKYIEKYGLEDFDTSIATIGELTKRNTGEYAIRPYIRRYPAQTIEYMKTWARSDNFHLRRLASEGLRPKLPWAAKLDLFIDDPRPVFQILDILKKEPVKFVKKSIANNLTDYIKVNPSLTFKLLDKWGKIKNEHTQWIVSYAARKLNK